MRGFRDLFITRRTFLIGWALVLLFVAGWMLPFMFVLARIAFLVVTMAMVADLWMLFGRMGGMAGHRHTTERWSNGDQNPVSIALASTYPMPVRVRVLDELPPRFQKRDLSFKATLGAWGERTFSYQVRPVERGVYAFGAIRVFVSTPIGLFERRFSLEAGREVAVHPSFLQLRRFELLAISDRLTLAGVKRIRRVAQNAEFERIKEYVPGDDRRTVNWKATARRGQLMVNQYQDEKAQQVFSLIDAGRVMKMPFEGMSLLDHAINAALVISNIAMHKQDKAGLFVFSDKVQQVVKAGRQHGHMQRIMQALYAVGTDHHETDMEALFANVRRQVTQRSLLLLFTNYESTSAMHRQLPFLQRMARQHLVVPIFFLNTELDDDLRRKPTDTEQVYVHTVMARAVQEKRAMAREFERNGMPAVLCRPEELTVSVINRYLEIKARGRL